LANWCFEDKSFFTESAAVYLLVSIGIQFGLTRERIRQIEKSGDKKTQEPGEGQKHSVA
jgi:DNA-directed RNA polymerase sigma subunit (sigma70/sigma32)